MKNNESHKVLLSNLGQLWILYFRIVWINSNLPRLQVAKRSTVSLPQGNGAESVGRNALGEVDILQGRLKVTERRILQRIHAIETFYFPTP